MKECSFTLNDLKTKFPRHEVVASLQCAGNRQEDYVTEDKPLYVAPHWTGGAIGTAKWAGVKVRDVLAAAGMDVDGLALNKVEYPEAKIVNFIAEDMDETGTPYAGVIPIEKATDPWGDALLVYEMNGETLPRDHGYPIRLLAPGHAGCRNVKWIKNIMVSAKPSELDSGSKLDRHFDPAVEFMDHLRFGDDFVRLDLGPVIQTMPITSIICKPGKGEILQMTDAGTVQVKGIAFSGGGRGVCRVEVSSDGGNTFDHCEMWGQKASVNPEMGQGRNWAWVQWEKRVKLPKDIAEKVKRGEIADVELVCKAIDGDFNTQPDKMESSYNSLGVQINHWDRVPIKVAKL
jgi:sulfite oxidase